tara:strand:+ start:912 stop:2048 length:1137 start_codon:yes stop_codon:yes gene_type:complete
MHRNKATISQLQDERRNEISSGKFWVYPTFDYNSLNGEEFKPLKKQYDYSRFQYYLCTTEWLLEHVVQDLTSTHSVIQNTVTRLLQNMIVDRQTIDDSTTEQQATDDVICDYFNGIKLHWLCADSRVTGMSYPIQGELTRDKQLIAHPGTYRWYASVVNRMNDSRVIFASTEKQLLLPLTFKEWVTENASGFIREQRLFAFKSPDNFPILEENENHHDFHIYNHGYALQELFAGKKITVHIGAGTTKQASQSKKRIIEQLEQHYQFNDNCTYSDHFEIKVINPLFKYSIPEINNFSGVSIYMDSELDVEHLLHGILHIDSVDSIAYLENHEHDFILFNNSHRDCKKLIKEIVHESKLSYLDTFLWTGYKNKIPEEVIL